MKSGTVLKRDSKLGLKRQNVLWITAALVTPVISTLVLLILRGVTQEPLLL